MPGRLPYSPSILEEILADMVRSALAWEEHHGPQTEEWVPGEGLTGIPRRVHCSAPDRRLRQEMPNGEDEDGHLNSEGACKRVPNYYPFYKIGAGPRLCHRVPAWFILGLPH